MKHTLLLRLASFAFWLTLAATATSQSSYRAYVLTYTDVPNSRATGISLGQMVGVAYGTGYSYPMLWRESHTNGINLHPKGFFVSSVYRVWGNQQVGEGELGTPSEGKPAHALLWHGTAESVIDLHPPQFLASSAAYDVCDGIQVGSLGGMAVLWRGSADSMVILNPTNAPGQNTPYQTSKAECAAGDYQGGYATYYASDVFHAVRWRGSAATMIDLHPPGGWYSDSEVLGIDCNGFAVGVGAVPLAYDPKPQPPSSYHALLWKGSARSFVDLHPIGFAHSRAVSVIGSTQVGFGSFTNGGNAALVWHGTAESVLNLHQFLPPEFRYSLAIDIDEFGNIIGYGSSSEDGQTAILWVPEIDLTSGPSLAIAKPCDSGGNIWIQYAGELDRAFVLEKSVDLVRWDSLVSTNTAMPRWYHEESALNEPGMSFFKAWYHR